MRTAAHMLALIVAAGACDHTMDPPGPDMPHSAPVATLDEIARFQELVDAVDTAAASYRGAMLEPALTHEGCLSAHATYDASVRPAIAGMLGLADELEGFMHMHGGAMYADLACSARAMMDEVDDHSHVACMWGDMMRDRMEASRHLGTMTRYTTHAAARCDEMLSGMDGGSWTWGPLVGCR